jgi:lambda family phage portal protein
MKLRKVLARAAGKVAGWLAGARNTFKGAELSRLWYDWIASPISADQEIYNDFSRLRGRAREMRRNHPLVRQYMSMLSTNIIGADGMQLRPRVRNRDGKINKTLNESIKEAWDDWSDEVTVDGLMGLVDLQHQLIECLAVDGETCLRKIRSYPDNRYRFALQSIDPDLLDHQFFRAAGEGVNEIRLGVEVNDWGRPIAYWFWDRHPTDLYNTGSRKRMRVPADEILHIYRPDRVNQTRGTTWLNSVMFPAKMVDGYVEAEVVAARTGAAKMGFFEVKDGAEYVPPKPGERLSIEAQPGQFEALPPGYEFKPWTPDHPGTAFPSFLKAIVRWIASGLRVSYNTLANDLEGVNYSSLRSALLTERDEWRKLQRWWARRVLKPIYAEWLEFAQLSGQLYLDSRDWNSYMRVLFMPRGWAWVDPLKDVNASIAEIDNALTSRQRVLDEQGLDFETIAEELSEEQKLIEELGLDLSGIGVGGGDTAGDNNTDNGDQQQQGNNTDRARRRRERLRLVSGLLAQER